MRGVAYSPTPIGVTPSAGTPLDYFDLAHSDIYGRDLPLLSRMGANTIRLTSLSDEDHNDFFNLCVQHNLTVIVEFDLSAGNYQLDTVRGRQIAESDLERALGLISHEAVTAWLIGDRLNAPWNGFVCDPRPTPCQFNGTEVSQPRCKSGDHARAHPHHWLLLAI